MTNLKIQKKYKKRYLRDASIFGIIGTIILPLVSLLFALQDSLTDSNFSVIGGSSIEKRIPHVLLCAFISLHFYSHLNFIMFVTGNEKFFARNYLKVAGGLLTISALFPYDPSYVNGWNSEIHIILSFIGVGLFILSFILLMNNLKYFDPKIYLAFTSIGFIALILFGIVVLKIFIINSLVEVIGLALASLFMYILSLCILKSKNFDPKDFYEYYLNKKTMKK